jgi:hypothetical protein
VPRRPRRSQNRSRPTRREIARRLRTLAENPETRTLAEVLADDTDADADADSEGEP